MGTGTYTKINFHPPSLSRIHKNFHPTLAMIQTYTLHFHPFLAWIHINFHPALGSGSLAAKIGHLCKTI